MLIIRDGWASIPAGREARRKWRRDLAGRTPFHDQLYAKYPMAKLSASGLDVGLPEGQMGNSEVGHLNLGAGRIVYQDLTRINKAIAEGELARNQVAQEAFAKARGHRLHFLGLVSEGGVHSHYRHLLALAEAAQAAGVKKIFVHAFTDGSDASPTGGADNFGNARRTGEKRRKNRHSRRPIFCDGSRSALGSDKEGVGRNRAWPAGSSPRNRRPQLCARGEREVRPMNSCRR